MFRSVFSERFEERFAALVRPRANRQRAWQPTSNPHFVIPGHRTARQMLALIQSASTRPSFQHQTYLCYMIHLERRLALDIKVSVTF
jgi:hypothetical protein